MVPESDELLCADECLDSRGEPRRVWERAGRDSLWESEADEVSLSLSNALRRFLCESARDDR